MAVTIKKCEHLKAITEFKKAETYACGECLAIGSQWVHLRTCQSCGVTLCCDSSPQQHASKHAKLLKHPVIISAEPNERWLWCYEHELMAIY